jgi:(p)ppGpp synthase/HD superfamily hydrolase
MNVTDAFLFAALAHRKQVDLQGQPYIIHLMAVVLACNEADRVAAALHDVVEDGHATLEELRARGVRDADLAVLDALSRRPGESYRDYILRLAGTPRAIGIKIHDLDHNFGRLSGLKQRDQLRLGPRYAAAIGALIALSRGVVQLDHFSPASRQQYARFAAHADDFLREAQPAEGNR